MELFKNKKINKLRYLLSTIILLIIFNICCTKNKNSSHPSHQNTYWGDVTLSEKNYYNDLVNSDIYSILKKQNNEYRKSYTKFNEDEINLNNSTSIKIIREELSDTNQLKINLYTFNKNKKTDSIRFYRNISGNGYGEYNCLSFFDKKNNKIWQINYFPSEFDKSVNIISYLESSIKPDGTIKTDSLYYLDESQEIIMQENNLYY